MSDDTGTNCAALADRLDREVDMTADPELSVDLRAAAVGLRRLAQLDTAIGPPMRLMDLMARGTTMDAEGDELAERLSLIYAAAVLGSGEQPEGPTTLDDN